MYQDTQWYDEDTAACGTYADMMSCQAQTWLAQKEVDQNMYITGNLFDPKRCAQAREKPRDAWDIESGLLQSQQTGLKFCYTKQPKQPKQEWEAQFGTLNAAQHFDQWTRSRSVMPTNNPCGCQEEGV